jgi:hypothetical protein
MKDEGVWANIVFENTKAFYVLCGGHNFNVHVGDVAKSSITAVNIFGTLQDIYTTFAVSTSLWGIKNIRNTSLKNPYWKQDGYVVQKAIPLLSSKFSSCFSCTGNMTLDNKIKNKVISIKWQLTIFEFILSLLFGRISSKSKFHQ